MNSTAKDKTVYIMLTRTDTFISKLIAVATRTKYTHAALSLDLSLTKLYSFGRLYAYIPWIGCFKHENTATGVYRRFRNSPCALFRLEVSESAYDAICARIREMTLDSGRYRYNIIGLFGNYIGHPIYRENYYFCSEFVADTLIRSDALRLSREPSLVRPNDFLEMGELKPVFFGTLASLREYLGCEQSERAGFSFPSAYAALLGGLRSIFSRAQ